MSESLQYKAEEYNQLVVDSKPELWTPGTEFQWAYFNKQREPGLVSAKVSKNTGNKIEFKVGKQTRERDIERLGSYGESGITLEILWL